MRYIPHSLETCGECLYNFPELSGSFLKQNKREEKKKRNEGRFIYFTHFIDKGKSKCFSKGNMMKEKLIKISMNYINKNKLFECIIFL